MEIFIIEGKRKKRHPGGTDVYATYLGLDASCICSSTRHLQPKFGSNIELDQPISS